MSTASRAGAAPPRTGRVAPPPSLWLRWSVRDLRQRWVQVAAIALVIALGTGTFTGLSSTASWRLTSYDASYEATAAHDLLIELAEGTTVDRDDLLAAVAAVEHPEWIEATATSLTVPVQVEVLGTDEPVLVPGRLVGVEPDAEVDRLATVSGRPLPAGEPGVVVLDEHFVAARDLPPEGALRLSGGREVRWVGTALSPRYFLIGAETGSFFGAAGFAVTFTTLERAQELAGLPGHVSELGVRLADGVDVEAAAADLEATLAERLDAAAEVTPLTEERGYRVLYDDIEGDQQLYVIFAVLILSGAAFAAFNLAGRMVEAQRREIGVGMSLGVPTRYLAVRPLLVSVEIAVLGTVLGVAVGVAMGTVMGSVIESFFPMPVWETPFQPGVFAQGLALGIVLTVSACAWPVVRAVRVPPIEAIRTGPRATRSGGLAPLVQRLPLPGSSLAQLPVRNLLRAPRRTLLTALGIAAMIATLVAVLGMVDSLSATIDEGEDELLGASPDRITVTMQGFELAGSEAIQAVGSASGVASASAGLRIGGTLTSDDDSFDVVLDVLDLEGGPWAPTAIEGTLESGEPALLLSEKAADDLGVGVGDTVRFRHPLREGLGYRWVESEVSIGAIHPNPYRFLAYLDLDHADLFGLEGIANVVEVVPAADADGEALRRALFELPGVGSVQPMAESIQLVRDTLDQVLELLTVVQWAVLLLAVLIAFNSSSIGADERAREHATMYAFGVPPRTVLGMSMVESAVVGVLATAIGVLAGSLLLRWMVTELIADTLPDLRIVVDVGSTTLVTAVLLGVVAVALAPVLTLRRLRRMDIPSTLRVVE